MDIAKMSMSMASANVARDVSMKMMKMSIDEMKEIGDMMAKMIPPAPAMISAPVSIDPYVGQFLDMSV